ncbi:hypothetical protein [Fimbriiglobus ruber]|uniref:Uncharacterized protein n=1 Tax=Fimbriiglobus ruber TaxID=1908690 RepID=A0A225D9W2_9BACT|nr:hypothetical protein [Fimbriiglobus ruber]OWK38400.1 hypothetical protein FRUB_07520 [Fimbriiglobus ruber]
MAANIHPRTGIRYGVLAGNAVPELLDDIQTGGTDLTFEAHQADVLNRVAAAIEEAVTVARSAPADYPDDEAKARKMEAEVKAAVKDLCPDRVLTAIDHTDFFAAVEHGFSGDPDELTPEAREAAEPVVKAWPTPGCGTITSPSTATTTATSSRPTPERYGSNSRAWAGTR